MTCHNCSSICKKFGKFGPRKLQRYRCKQCRKTFSEEHEKAPRAPRPEGPLGKMRISLDKAETCLKLLLEGMSIRSVQRVTGLHQETILDLIVLAGERCEKLMLERIKGIAVKDVEADEIWQFVHCKNRHKLHKGISDPKVGDAYTWVGIERNTKLVLAWHLGQRDTTDCEAFTEKLHEATSGHFQLTTDGYAPYKDCVWYSLGTRVDYAQLIKVYARDREAEQKYSPPEVVETITRVIIGNPEPHRICTSIVERNNLSIRTSVRRLTRLTNAFSKKWENLRAMLAIYFAFYNFCRIHSSIRCTPAMETGITNTVWTIRDLLTA